MADLGSITLSMALILSVYSLAASVIGKLRGIDRLLDSSRYAVYVLVAVLIVSVFSLVSAFLSSEFEIAYVREHSNLAMPRIYTWVAFYAGNEGSLLYIAFALSLMSALAIRFAPQYLHHSLPYTNAFLMTILTFFLAVMITMANPFSELSFSPSDGLGINPLLTHFGMFIHPPVMMAGLISVSIPMGFAMGSLIAGSKDDGWTGPGRTWGIISWVLLGSGLLLGAWWAYTILGWGGYWAWDPVENAGFMPFIALTAFIHSIMVQRRRGIFRMWNIALINIAFVLSLYGMFINRGGPIPSIHSFGASDLGWVFLVFTIVGLVVPFMVFLLRYRYLKSEQTIESNLSREAAFLANNLLFLSVAFVTFWGAIFPLLSELFKGTTVTVGAPFYNQVNGPLFVAIIFLMGVGPFLPWRRSNIKVVIRVIRLPGILALGICLSLILMGIREIYPLISFSLCGLVVFGILLEWAKGTIARRKRGENYLIVFFLLIWANRPRYGGYIVHLAVVMLALGIVGSSFYGIQKDVIMSPGEVISVGDFDLRYIGEETYQMSDRTEFRYTVEAYSNGSLLATLNPERAFYPAFRMSSTRAGIRSTPVQDVYIIPSESMEGGKTGFRIYVNPLVWWMWVAGPILILGTVVTLWPSRSLRVSSEIKGFG